MFYDPKEQRVLVSTNARFLEPSSKVVLNELRAEINEGNGVPIPETTASPPLVVRT